MLIYLFHSNISLLALQPVCTRVTFTSKKNFPLSHMHLAMLPEGPLVMLTVHTPKLGTSLELSEVNEPKIIQFLFFYSYLQNNFLLLHDFLLYLLKCNAYV